MAAISQETHYSEGEVFLFAPSLLTVESSGRLVKSLQETVQDHACLQATLPLEIKRECNSSGSKFSVMVCPLCSNEPPRRPMQETSAWQEHSAVLRPASATGSHITVAKKKV